MISSKVHMGRSGALCDHFLPCIHVVNDDIFLLLFSYLLCKCVISSDIHYV